MLKEALDTERKWHLMEIWIYEQNNIENKKLQGLSRTNPATNAYNFHIT